MRIEKQSMAAPSLDELARLQGVQPVPNLEEWLAQLPPDDPIAPTEDILEVVLRMRKELRKQEACS